MKLAGEFVLIDADGFGEDPACVAALKEIRAAIAAVVWPPGSDRFTIYPESGKKRGEGSGVVPIRKAFVDELVARGWQTEAPFPLTTDPEAADFGEMDAAKVFGDKLFLVEWETGNISSSHRALNKIAIGLVSQAIAGGVLVVPTRDFAQYLTDRIGNLRELLPYFDLWRSVPAERGLMVVFAVEHDDTSTDVPRIRKGTDGRARS